VTRRNREWRVPFYGGGIAPGLLDRASKMQAPSLLIWGGLDKHRRRVLLVTRRETAASKTSRVSSRAQKFTGILLSGHQHSSPPFNVAGPSCKSLPTPHRHRRCYSLMDGLTSIGVSFDGVTVGKKAGPVTSQRSSQAMSKSGAPASAISDAPCPARTSKCLRMLPLALPANFHCPTTPLPTM
jgi:hypothetical protein